jgi:ketosteroid isomerase-like protein
MMKPKLLIPLAALVWGVPAAADTRPETFKDIAAIEQAWGDAFLKGDRAYLEKIIAPEFVLMRAENGETLFTPRSEWFATLDRFTFHVFEVKTVGVVAAGDTAVATVTGRWKVGMKGREGTREEAFVLSDTFVRRAGAWQVVYRHSSPFPIAPAAKSAERGGGAGI